MPVKTGLLGGAFNPPHNAHLALARSAFEAFHLENLIFVPTRAAPHKTIEGDWDGKTRSLMIRIASFSDRPEEIVRRMETVTGLTKDPGSFLQHYSEAFGKSRERTFTVSDIEIEKPEVSYTIDTVKSLQKGHPERELFVIIGMDQAVVFDTWKNWQELSRLAQVCAANRPGSDTQIVRKKFPFIKIFEMAPSTLSSTKIREKLANHQSIGTDVPKIIQEFLSLFSECQPDRIKGR